MELFSHRLENSKDSSSYHSYCYDPEECPICKRAIKAHFLYGYTNIEYKKMYTVYECMACHNSFIKTSDVLITESSPNYTVKELLKPTPILAPNPAAPVTFSRFITDISPKFSDIYNQANAAECANLDEIAGIGYRKSIEFLIKDYLCIGKTDAEQEVIKDKFLGKCISEDIDNKSLKIAAERAVWIGNDETHYIRKHTDKDITDLKRLINLTVRWIEMECMTKEAEGIPYIK